MTLDTKAMKATLDKEYVNPQDSVYAFSQGNLQQLDDGHVIMGYGSTPKIREFSSDGATVMTAQFGPGDGLLFSYRAYRLPWEGRPTEPPNAFACIDQSSNTTMLYMSWLGATEYESWKVFTGSSTSSLTLNAHVERTGFETAISIPGQSHLIRVEAQELGVTSGVSPVTSPSNSC